jgi:hypothetical protein
MGWFEAGDFPQELKPRFLSRSYGMAKAMPFQISFVGA